MRTTRRQLPGGLSAAAAARPLAAQSRPNVLLIMKDAEPGCAGAAERRVHEVLCLSRLRAHPREPAYRALSSALRRARRNKRARDDADERDHPCRGAAPGGLPHRHHRQVASGRSLPVRPPCPGVRRFHRVPHRPLDGILSNGDGTRLGAVDAPVHSLKFKVRHNGEMAS